MAFSFIANTAKQSTDTNGFTTSSINTTGANLIVIVTVNYNGAAAPSISDNQGNTYSGGSTYAAALLMRCRTYYVEAPTTNASHTFTITSGGGYPSIAVAAFSGGTTSSLDQESNDVGTGSGTSHGVGSVTPTEDNELIIAGAGFATAGFPTSGVAMSGFTVTDWGPNLSGQAFGMGLAYQIQTTATTRAQNFTWTGSSTMVGWQVTFKAGGGVAFMPRPPLVVGQFINRAGSW